MSQFLSHLHAEVRLARLTRRGATHRPDEVPMGRHKKYERMETIPLVEPRRLDMSLEQALATRSSQRSPSIGSPLSVDDFSSLLGHGLKKRDDTHKRNYPSGGGLYPIETYLVSSAIAGHDPGVFHYNPTLHALERLWDVPDSLDIKSLSPMPKDNLFSSLLIFTSVWDRSSAKYGDLSYSHAMLEAGHMSENILLLATALGINACPMAGFNDEKLIELLDIEPEFEQPVHTITLSRNFGAEG